MYLDEGKLVFSADEKKIEAIKDKLRIQGGGSADQVSGLLKGINASLGRAKGAAAVVLCADDLPKVKKGDVMITVTTHPDYVPAMNRACAIVTDEGGMTCHAAIVAREMKKPCIVGTKNATKVFKDRDVVEVDADKGIVRKVK